MPQAITSSIYGSNVYGQLLIRPAAEASAIWTPAAPAVRRTGLRRHLARRWDLYGILALMASSAAYAVSALAHLA